MGEFWFLDYGALEMLDDDPDPLLDHPSRANIRRLSSALGVAPSRPNDAR